MRHPKTLWSDVFICVGNSSRQFVNLQFQKPTHKKSFQDSQKFQLYYEFKPGIPSIDL